MLNQILEMDLGVFDIWFGCGFCEMIWEKIFLFFLIFSMFPYGKGWIKFNMLVVVMRAHGGFNGNIGLHGETASQDLVWCVERRKGRNRQNICKKKKQMRTKERALVPWLVLGLQMQQIINEKCGWGKEGSCKRKRRKRKGKKKEKKRKEKHKQKNKKEFTPANQRVTRAFLGIKQTPSDVIRQKGKNKNPPAINAFPTLTNDNKASSQKGN